MHLSLAAFKSLVRDQFFVLQLDGERAVEALAALVPEADARENCCGHVREIASAGEPPTAAERDRLARLSQVLPTAAPPASRRLRSPGRNASAPRRTGPAPHAWVSSEHARCRSS